jgi:CPA2 family monovalent cation:H+ antiporter-2
MDEAIVRDLFIILAAGLVAAVLCKRLGVSMLVGYLVVGAVIGASGLGLVTDRHHEVEYVAEAGVLLLLFSIGLEFSLRDISRLARHLFLGGTAQMTLVCGPIFLAMLGYGAPWRAALMLGLAAAVSSTVLVFKALAELGATTTAGGRRAIGILLFQDVAIVPILLLIPILTGQGGDSSGGGPIRLLLTTILFVAGVLVVRRVIRAWVVPLLVRLRSPEIVVLFAVVVLGMVSYASHVAGLAPPLGAFAAGLILSDNRLTGQIDALVLPFREAFAAVFFVSVGLLFDADLILRRPAFLAFGFVSLILLKSVAAAAGARLTGLRGRGALGVGIGLSQVGEFGFVVAFAGWEAGLLSQDYYHALLIIAIGSLVVTPWLLRIGIGWSQGEGIDELAALAHRRGPDAGSAIVVGIGPIGRAVARRLKTQRRVTAVDLSPVNLQPLAQEGCLAIAGDAAQRDVLERAGAKEAMLAVVCVPSDEVAMAIVEGLRRLNRTLPILVRCRFAANVRDLQKSGANAVVSEEAQASEALLGALGRTGLAPAPPASMTDTS